MFYAVDRLEGALAVLEDEEENTAVWPLDTLPAGTGEGTVLALEEGVWRLAPEEAARRREEALRLQEQLRHS